MGAIYPSRPALVTAVVRKDQGVRARMNSSESELAALTMRLLHQVCEAANRYGHVYLERCGCQWISKGAPEYGSGHIGAQ
jgi:hypothetical protein